MPGGRKSFVGLLVLCLMPLTALPLTAWADGPRPAPRVIEFQPPAPRGPSACGVIGEVVRPGVYQTPNRVTLRELIDRAGGITNLATGTVRFIRGGRPGQMVSLASGLNFPLLHGDLLVVEGQTARGGQDGVQLALVGLLDRPVVLKVQSDLATRRGLVEMIGQSPDIADMVQVIAGNHVGAQSFATEQLASGSVLLFTAARIDKALLPEFPEPHPWDEPQQSQQPQQPAASASLPRLDPVLPNSSAATPESPREPSPSQPQPETAPFGLLPPALSELPATPASSPSKLPMLPPGPLGFEADELPAATPKVEPPKSTPRTLRMREPASSQGSKHTATKSPPIAAAKSDKPKRSGGSVVVVMIAVVATLSVLIAAALWLRRRRGQVTQREETAEPEASTASQPADGQTLELLIRQQLPLIEEQVRLPAALTFYGSPAPSVTYRVDQPAEPHTEAAEPRGPHFRRSQVVEPVVQAVEVEEEPAPPPSNREPQSNNRVPQPHFKRRKAGPKRRKAEVREQARPSRPQAEGIEPVNRTTATNPPTGSVLERALRNLQGADRS